MIPLIIVLCVLAVVVLLSARLVSRFTSKAPGTRFLLPALAIGIVALMLTPTLWAAIPILQGTESDLPLAGPSQAGGLKVGTNGQTGVDPALVRYLEEHQGNAQVLVATNSIADEIILATNKPVMPLAGFSSYPLTTTELASLVATGRLRFILLSQMQIPPHLPDQSPKQGQVVQGVGNGPGNDQHSAITTWVTQHCKTVPPSLWQSSATAGTGSFGSGAANQLYDCAATH